MQPIQKENTLFMLKNPITYIYPYTDEPVTLTHITEYVDSTGTLTLTNRDTSHFNFKTLIRNSLDAPNIIHIDVNEAKSNTIIRKLISQGILIYVCNTLIQTDNLIELSTYTINTKHLKPTIH